MGDWIRELDPIGRILLTALLSGAIAGLCAVVSNKLRGV